MHATAQASIRASILQADPAASPAALRKALFLRLYGQEFDAGCRRGVKKGLNGLNSLNAASELNLERSDLPLSAERQAGTARQAGAIERLER